MVTRVSPNPGGSPLGAFFVFEGGQVDGFWFLVVGKFTYKPSACQDKVNMSDLGKSGEEGHKRVVRQSDPSGFARSGAKAPPLAKRASLKTQETVPDCSPPTLMTDPLVGKSWEGQAP